MKKLILTVAILAGGISTFALSNNILPTETITILNQEFKEITINELPTAVTNAILKDFPSATVSKAYVNNKGQYKLILSIKEESKTVYANEKGEWLEETDAK
ncbi:hypothetical protein A8C32_00315 [Flavivirga aquatica]|uniref:Beta-lactamase-inhibitor-like PepSY-like domain-containing protein n=1 Tax=Flavivirga aquatica TaxID=1849968 RepID=A0A1E5TBM7_9FLAO|nr:hypothetical protein [Flavivirga aquatica]OEK08756.1 hypothetical protein A8C32_00315 [Flavivirga aquatica]